MSASGDGGKALHELVHQIQDALIAQNTRRIRELDTRGGHARRQLSDASCEGLVAPSRSGSEDERGVVGPPRSSDNPQIPPWRKK